MSAITYRITDSIEDMQKAEYLQQAVWGMTPIDTLGATTMRWMTHIGGLLIGAWDGSEMIGFCISSVGKRDGKWVLWSDMAGVHPHYQGQGIGYQMKQHQKIWAREQGYEEIRWTFDPMQRGNAFFNFHKLGVISHHYHPAFYGEMHDDINRGLPADRLEAIWFTGDNPDPKPEIIQNSPAVVTVNGQSVITQESDHPQIQIEIPYNLKQLKQENPQIAKEWQFAVQKQFTHYFHNGYQAIDFCKSDMRSWYILHKNLNL